MLFYILYFFQSVASILISLIFEYMIREPMSYTKLKNINIYFISYITDYVSD